MAKRIAFGTIAILTVLTLFSVDALVSRWARGGGPPPAPIDPDYMLPTGIAVLVRHGSTVPIGLAVVIALGAAELLRLFSANGANPDKWFTIAMTVATFLTPWLSAGGWLGSDVAAIEGLYWPLVTLALSVIGAATLRLFRGDPAGTLRDVSATALTVLYLGFLCSFGLQLRSGMDSPTEQGVWLLLITLLITKASDIGAYFTGSAIGRHKLAPRISPGKSVEGAVGGIVASICAAALFAYAEPIAARFSANDAFLTIVTDMAGAFGTKMRDGSIIEFRVVILGVALSISGQIGDLFESCLKRDAGAKDSGRLIPQLGGILDLIDSPVFSVPVSWFLLTRVWHVV